MEIHTGRLIDHLHLRTRDLQATRRFYAAILDVLGVPYVSDDTHFQADELWIDVGEQPSRVHLAFQAKDRATVDRAYEAALDRTIALKVLAPELANQPGFVARLRREAISAARLRFAVDRVVGRSCSLVTSPILLHLESGDKT